MVLAQLARRMTSCAVAVMLVMVKTVSPTLTRAKFCPLEWTPTRVLGKVVDEGLRATPLTGAGMAK